MKGKFILCGALVIICLTLSAQMNRAAWANEKPSDYPNKTITLMHGFPAGGSSDVGCRLVAEALRKVIAQPVVVEAKPGAGSQIMLTEFKNNAKPDGYTMALINVPQIQTIVFDPTRKAAFGFKDFQPIANHVQDPGTILVRKGSPFKTLEDFLAAAKAKPGQISVSTSGLGSDDHLAILDLQRRTGLKFNIVHLRGTAEMLSTALGGHIDVAFDNIGGFLPTAMSGEARLLAVMMEKRYPDLPDVPTFREKGVDLLSSSTRGYVMPAGTPMGIIKYIEQSLKKGMEDPEHIKRMKDAGLTLKFMGVEEYSRFIEGENNRAQELIKLYRR